MGKIIHKIIKIIYKRYVDELYFPNRKIEVFVKEKDCCSNEQFNSCRITVNSGYSRGRWKNSEEKYVFNYFGDKVTIWKK